MVAEPLSEVEMVVCVMKTEMCDKVVLIRGNGTIVLTSAFQPFINIAVVTK